MTRGRPPLQGTKTGGRRQHQSMNSMPRTLMEMMSHCQSIAKNYTQLQQLHAKYAESGLRILGFPCNQFGSQEPGTNEEIKKFATDTYSVQFDMFSKINVNGGSAHPLYSYLKKKQSGTLGDFIKWNFSKFLVDREGQPVKRYAPNTQPLVKYSLHITFAVNATKVTKLSTKYFRFRLFRRVKHATGDIPILEHFYFMVE
ncbi:hypothetical protein FSP39_014492 [Pinctada imbricata]|uniref:Glutathione peroxidase n=1 Tax=Pinctada imbricata TaxID=66713 RepID=A0AA88XS12_PINIB|nr:hypothetical protein FSP39_014492 [Pinctada imbricata]